MINSILTQSVSKSIKKKKKVGKFFCKFFKIYILKLSNRCTRIKQFHQFGKLQTNSKIKHFGKSKMEQHQRCQPFGNQLLEYPQLIVDLEC